MRTTTWVIVLLAFSGGATAQQPVATPALNKVGELAAATPGFDARRDGIARGSVETVEYDQRSRQS
jgi:hypothetical protein